MKTSDLIKIIKENKLTETQIYNLLISDLYEAVTVEEVAEPASQKLIGFFMYKIQEVLCPVINDLKS